jgi:large conductance mechanosensitive channel
MGITKEFKEFAMKGSVLDLAVGVVIGAAFGKIVDSLVKDIIMPIVGILTGGYDFSSLSIKVGEAELKYGNFIQASLNFLIIAFILFLVIKAANRMRAKEEAKAAA